MARGTNDQFDELHGLTCRMLLKMLRAADQDKLIEGVTDDGDPLYVLPPPALLAQAIKFLKENGIDRPASTGIKKDTLKDAMPDLDQIERGSVIPFRK